MQGHGGGELVSPDTHPKSNEKSLPLPGFQLRFFKKNLQKYRCDINLWEERELRINKGGNAAVLWNSCKKEGIYVEKAGQVFLFPVNNSKFYHIHLIKLTRWAAS